MFESVLNGFNGLPLLLGLLLVALCIFLQRKYRQAVKLLGSNRKKVDSALVVFILLSIALSIFNLFFRELAGRGELQSILRSIFYSWGSFFLNIIPVVIGLYIADKLGFFDDFKKVNIAKSLTDEEVQDNINELWKSEGFLTTLKTSLPKGEKDTKFGLDYIPFMLDEVQTRQKKYFKESNKYLKATLFSILSFSVVLISFGYVLIVDDSVGVVKEIASLERKLTKIDNSILRSLPDIKYHIENKSIIYSDSERLEKILRNDFPIIYHELAYDYFNFKTIPELKAFLINLQRLNVNLKKDNVNQYSLSNIQSTINSLSHEIERTIDDYNDSTTLLVSNIKKLNEYTDKIQGELESSDYRYFELLRRLSIGIVVSSFLLVLVRYLSLIYRENYNQMLKAEQDELTIRKFYVSYRSSDQIVSLRQQSVSSLFGENGTNSQKNTKDKMSQHEASVIKELITSITKKIP